ncbi:MAG: hypothetical protein N2438_03205 [Limisphaera sp.]|nr:hypothetical protein [Limisphaera sp.]
MKMRKRWLGMWSWHPRVIACWGTAKLVREPDGRYRLHGGTPADRQAALEWISFFLHEALVAVEHGRRAHSSTASSWAKVDNARNLS